MECHKLQCEFQPEGTVPSSDMDMHPAEISDQQGTQRGDITVAITANSESQFHHQDVS